MSAPRPTGRKRPPPYLPEHVRFAPDSGRILLFDQRMMLMHGFSLAELRRELIERLGIEQARATLTRLGYQQGIEDYKRLRAEFGDDADMHVRLGPRMRDIEGHVRTEPLHLEVDSARGRFYGEYAWTESWESKAHIDHLGIGTGTACWMSIGYASGYATGVFGRPVLFREIECVALGHARCKIIGQPLDAWEDVSDARFLQVEAFVDAPTGRRPSPSDAGAGSEAIVQPTEGIGGLVGVSPGFNAVIYLLKRVAATDATVLFLGESGVGKEQFSKTLHRIGPRAAQPFISINCAAIPAELVEAELFGVEKGAYTGATQSRPGRFERAHGGTLFLDEIGSLPLPAQGKLLRVLQEREIERVGDSQVRKVDVRIVAATNEDLRKAVANGRFRADLFYRLNVFPVEIPPLRARREDVPLLFNLFVDRYAHRFGKRVAGVSRAALGALWSYDWPGNVRELENLVERAVILVDDDGTIDLPQLFSGGEVLGERPLQVSPMGLLVCQPEAPLTEGAPASRNPDALADGLLDELGTLEQVEALLIDRALHRHDGNLTAAARSLGMGRGQMQYRIGKRRGGPDGSEPD